MERRAGQPHGPRWKADAEPRVETNLANESANPPGAVLLQDMHCSSENPWGRVLAPSLSQGRKGQLQPKSNITESSFPTSTWHTARPPRSPGGSVRTSEMGRKTEDSSPKEGKGKYSKTGNCQLLPE